MTGPLRLASGACEAVFDPADGGRLTSFRVDGLELLVKNGVDAFHWGSFVIAPWTGRLRDARFGFAAQEHRFPANSGPHALHGLVTERPWHISGDGELTIELNDPWPWPSRVVQRTTLTHSSAEFRIEVHADEPMPAAVGWHPWFVRRIEGTPPEAELELDVQPMQMWANDESDLPLGNLVAPLPRPWDYCFRGLTSDPVLRWPGVLELTVQSDCPDWVIYDREAAGVCVEPWTGPPNSLNLPDPDVVQPGRPLVATMRWRWR